MENVDVISWSPRVFHFKKMLTEADCDHIIEIGMSVFVFFSPGRILFMLG